MFVFSELLSPAQTEEFICYFWPPGVVPGHLRALLASPPFNETPYMDHLADIATCLVLSGHQRSLVGVLQEMGVLPLDSPLPPIQVIFIFIPLFFLKEIILCCCPYVQICGRRLKKRKCQVGMKYLAIFWGLLSRLRTCGGPSRRRPCNSRLKRPGEPFPPLSLDYRTLPRTRRLTTLGL
jgi:hypothetical protein